MYISSDIMLPSQTHSMSVALTLLASIGILYKSERWSELKCGFGKHPFLIGHLLVNTILGQKCSKVVHKCSNIKATFGAACWFQYVKHIWEELQPGFLWKSMLINDTSLLRNKEWTYPSALERLEKFLCLWSVFGIAIHKYFEISVVRLLGNEGIYIIYMLMNNLCKPVRSGIILTVTFNLGDIHILEILHCIFDLEGGSGSIDTSKFDIGDSMLKRSIKSWTELDKFLNLDDSNERECLRFSLYSTFYLWECSMLVCLDDHFWSLLHSLVVDLY